MQKEKTAQKGRFLCAVFVLVCIRCHGVEARTVLVDAGEVAVADDLGAEPVMVAVAQQAVGLAEDAAVVEEPLARR